MNTCTGMGAFDVQPALETPDNHCDAGEPESCRAFPGAEEGIERPRSSVSEESVTCVGDRHPDVPLLARWRPRLPNRRRGLNRESAAVRHRLATVGGEIQEGPLQLSSVHLRERINGTELQPHAGLWSEHTCEDALELRYKLVDVDCGSFFDRRWLAKSNQLATDAERAIDGAFQLAEFTIGGFAGFEALFERF